MENVISVISECIPLFYVALSKGCFIVVQETANVKLPENLVLLSECLLLKEVEDKSCLRSLFGQDGSLC